METVVRLRPADGPVLRRKAVVVADPADPALKTLAEAMLAIPVNTTPAQHLTTEATAHITRKERITTMNKNFLTVLATAALFCMTATSASFAGDNGTVTVNGQVWLKNADCFGKVLYSSAQSAVAGLANGQCGLTDGSTQGQWRLPTLAELKMINTQRALFSNATGTHYWSSDVVTGLRGKGIVVFTGNFAVSGSLPSHGPYSASYRDGSMTVGEDKPYNALVWPVKR